MTEFFKKNRKKYFGKTIDSSVSIFFSGHAFQRTADQDFDFEVDKNFYYLSGINQANVILVLVKQNNTLKETLFIEKNDPVLVKWVGKKLELSEASEISGIVDVQYLEDFDNHIYNILNSTRKSQLFVNNLYLNLERRNSPFYNNRALSYANEFKTKYPEVNILNSYNIVVELRMVKEQVEIEKIKKAISITHGGINELMKNSKPGMYEYQLESHFDFYIKHQGNYGFAFKTIAAAGENATILHYENNNSKINDNELILFDLGCRNDFYVSDISRTFPVNGKFTKRQAEVYQEVLDVNKKCIDFLKPGITWAEFNNYAKDLLAQSCIRLGLITDPKDVIKYYYHSIGHSIGLDTHDPSIYTIPIQEGVVLTVEPGLYIEEEKIGIRIEDNILITKNGNINLSKDIIKEIVDIENFMK